MSAEQAFLRAQSYRQAGRIELSRKWLLKTIEMNSNSRAAKLAAHCLKFSLPKEAVPQEAEQRNIIAFNQAKNGDINAAKQNFANLIQDFPKFEWPYANLASIYAREGKFVEAEKLLSEALSINPNYANARVMLVKLQNRKEGKYESQQGLATPD